MQNDQNNWSISEERAFMENLLNQRFNFFLIFFSLVIAGILNAKTQMVLIFLFSIGFLICFILTATLMRAQQKLDIILTKLFSDISHPVSIVNSQAKAGISVRKSIGYLIPCLCTILLGIGLFLSVFEIIKPQC